MKAGVAAAGYASQVVFEHPRADLEQEVGRIEEAQLFRIERRPEAFT